MCTAPGHRRGPITALTFVLTIEDPGRFPKNREVGAYLALVPQQRVSGERAPQLGISKSGDAGLRQRHPERAVFRAPRTHPYPAFLP